MFTINGELWYLKFVPSNYSKLFRSDGSLSIAACDDVDRIIYINNSLNGLFLKKVLCHEITHAAMFSYDVGLSYQEEELLADLIATYGEEIIQVTETLFEKLKERW